MPKSLPNSHQGLSGLHPWRLTWNLNLMVWKMIFLVSWVIFRFHVNLPGCSSYKRRKKCHGCFPEPSSKVFVHRPARWRWVPWPPIFLVIVFWDPTLPFQGSKFGDIEEWRTCRKQCICVISMDYVIMCVYTFNICIPFAYLCSW